MDFARFLRLIVEVLGANRGPNPRQAQCVAAAPGNPTLIVAGPGSGKTSVLVLRAIRHILIDRILPEHITITTFTVKAAKEIRTRLLEWGEPIFAYILANASDFEPDLGAFVRNVDVNRVLAGTLDSLCQDALGEHREPGERRYVVVEGFSADVLLSRVGEVGRERNELPELNDYLAQFSMFGQGPRNTGDTVRSIRAIVDRFIQDGVDVDAYANAEGPFLPSRQAIKRIYDRYVTRLRADHQMDFSLLEQTFLERVMAGQIPGGLALARAILVDEYQDTNPLQELIYLNLARQTNASLTVVGDDDQSLYRFRGATIELFRNFRDRAEEVLGRTPHDTLYLVDNYRSSPEIVAFYNSFIVNDPDFGPARVDPPKPAIVPTKPSQWMPVIGMFRDDASQLATALGGFLHQVFRGTGRPADDSLAEAITAARQGGDLGDAVLLGPTVGEYTSDGGRERFPSLLRSDLETRGLFCFNPRGRALRDIPEVQQLLGLVLQCIEPASPALSIDGVFGQMRITQEAQRYMAIWRDAANRLRATNPGNVRNVALADVIARWSNFTRTGAGRANEWPLLDVFYSFIPWLPGFRDDPEGQVYLEAISRCAAQAATFSSYRGLLLREDEHRSRSIAVAVRDVLAPIGDDLVEVDEDIMPSVPRNRLNIMTVHQAKGLEFPLVIVDVASDFKTNHVKQRFRRFPDTPTPAAVLENELADYTAIGPLRLQRDQMQRTFEDIIRLYYVAYSRPQSLLMLVGTIPNIRYSTTIKNIGLFWRRDETWAWRTPERPPPVRANACPISFI